MGRLVVVAACLATVAAAAAQLDDMAVVVDDIDPAGKCAAAAAAHCEGVKAGGANLYDCLKNQLKAQNNGKGGGDSEQIKGPCAKEVREFKVERSKSFVLDTKLYDACEGDAAKLCIDIPQKPGAVLGCLRKNKDKLNSKCEKQVFVRKEEAANDFKADAGLDEMCSTDAAALCADVKEGEGRVQSCLRSKRAQISWDCQEELFRQEVEDSGDFRLNAALRAACATDAKQFCKDIKPGNARVKDCLEDNREKPGMSATCKTEFEKMMARRAVDFRLDSKLKKQCATDIDQVCGFEKETLDNVAGFDSRVAQCLQDYKDELGNPECKARVHQLTMRASQDIRLDQPLWEACATDRTELCPNVPPGSSRVIRCLQDQRLRLSFECRATLFDQEMRFAEDIDFKQPMKKACAEETKRLCKGVQQGHARIIQCLRDNEKKSDMSEECKAEVKRDEIRSAQDFRLNTRLSRTCDLDIDALCADACLLFSGQACGGTVLRCLQSKQANVTKPECKKEIFNIEKGEVDDWRRDALLSDACKPDVAKLCAGVKAGSGAVHRCLRDHALEMSDECKAEELNLATMQSKDVRLMPQLEAECKDEIKGLCKNVPAGNQRVLRCLQTNLKSADMGAKCADQVDKWSQRSARNYKLDYGISKLCGADIGQYCEGIESSGRSNIIRCLVNNYNKTSVSCQHETGRAIKMAMMLFHKAAPLTSVCDADAEMLCPETGSVTRSSFSKAVIGASFKCLGAKVDANAGVSEACAKLVSISRDAKTVDPRRSSSAKQIAAEVVKMEKVTLGREGQSGPTGALVLTGWIALIAVGSLAIVVVGLIIFLVRKYRGERATTLYQPVPTVLKDGGA